MTKTNTEGEASRTRGMAASRGQIRNPITDRYVKVDTVTGRILDSKKTPGPYKGIRELTRTP
jgi:hypothetical protein